MGRRRSKTGKTREKPSSEEKKKKKKNRLLPVVAGLERVCVCVVGYIMKREGRAVREAGKQRCRARMQVGGILCVCMCVLLYPCAYEPVKVVRICI